MRKRRLAAEYMKQLFAPQDPLTEAKGQLESYLAQVPVWLGAEAYKKLMLTEPLNIMREGTIPIKILLGEMDPMAQGQKVLTDHYGKDSSLVVKGAGHALPWTHPDLVLDEIISQFKNSALQ
jgi:pimeloyl-ACP methyl ester carboxylesterase